MPNRKNRIINGCDCMQDIAEEYSKRIVFSAEDDIGEKWVDFARVVIPDYQRWFRQLNINSSITAEQSLHAIATYMPLMLESFNKMVDLLGLAGDEITLLSFYCPPPASFGCSQAVWLRQYPVLVRNFDYFPGLNEGRYLQSAWHGTRVIASTDCIWGALDGMNEYGLSVSVTLVGSVKQSAGFAASVVVRYMLEFCKTTAEAVDVLMRVPLCTAYNFSIVDAHFIVKTVEVNPLVGIFVSSLPVATNHQGDIDEFLYPNLYNSVLRKKTLLDQLYSPYSSLESFMNSFAYFPLLNTDVRAGTSTLYTVAYNSHLKAVEYRWPNGAVLYQSFFDFYETEFWIPFAVH